MRNLRLDHPWQLPLEFAASDHNRRQAGTCQDASSMAQQEEKTCLSGNGYFAKREITEFPFSLVWR
jgi:hypothetical protein